MRTLRLLGVLWLVSLGSFLLLDLIPGDPVVAVLGRDATPAAYQQLRGQLGLDQPLLRRYADWLGGLLTGDAGDTLVRPVRPVLQVVGDALPVTVEVSLLALLLGLLCGIPLGIWAAHRSGGLADRVIGAATFGLVSVPVFVMGLLLIILMVFNADIVRLAALALGVLGAVALLAPAVRARPGVEMTAGRIVTAIVSLAVGAAVWATLPDFPRQGWVPLTQDPVQNLRSAFLPALTLSLGLIPLFAQVLRSDMQETLRQDYIVIARAKGMSTQHILLREALRPSLFSLVTVAGLSLGQLLGGTVIVETLFNLPGLGKLVVASIQSKDFSVVQVSVLLIAAAFVLLNAAVDLLYTLLEPRIRRAGH